MDKEITRIITMDSQWINANLMEFFTKQIMQIKKQQNISISLVKVWENRHLHAFCVWVQILGGKLVLSYTIWMSIILAFDVSTQHPGIYPTEVLLKGSKDKSTGNCSNVPPKWEIT